MKRILLSVVIAALAAALYGQSHSLDEFFSRYANREGYTNIVFNGNLFGLLKNHNDDAETEDLRRKINSVRIISREEGYQTDEPDFLSELRDVIRHGNYEEVMKVKDSDDDLLFLIRNEADRITELVIISSGDDNTVIHIKGNLSKEDVDQISLNHDRGIALLEELETTGK